MTTDALPMHYAGFWKRLTAYGYDSLFVTIIAILAGWALGGVAHAQTAQDIQVLIDGGLLPPGTDINSLNAGAGDLVSWGDMFIALLTSAIYNIFFVAGSWQATPGKRWCNIKVVYADGGKLTLKESALRHAASGISMLLGGLGYITMFFMREKMALHDMICHTRVVYGKAPSDETATNYS